MKQIEDKYGLIEKEVKFLDNYAAKMMKMMPEYVKAQLRGSKEHLKYHMEGILEVVLTEMAKRPDLERVASTEKVKQFAEYLTDKLHTRINSRLII